MSDGRASLSTPHKWVAGQGDFTAGLCYVYHRLKTPRNRVAEMGNEKGGAAQGNKPVSCARPPLGGLHRRSQAVRLYRGSVRRGYAAQTPKLLGAHLRA